MRKGLHFFRSSALHEARKLIAFFDHIGGFASEFATESKANVMNAAAHKA
jgi:hypothetical protein